MACRFCAGERSENWLRTGLSGTGSCLPLSVTVEITVNTAYPGSVAVSRRASSHDAQIGGALAVAIFLAGFFPAASGRAQVPPPTKAADSTAAHAPLRPVGPDSSAAHAPGQEVGGEQDLPPTEHPFDIWDALGLPLRVLTAPLAVVGIAVREGLRLVAPGSGSPRSPAGPGPLGARILAGSVGPRSGPAVGLRVQEPAPGWAEAMASIRGSWRAAGGVDVSPVAFHLGVERHAEPHFWGIGPDTRPEDRTDFGWRRWEALGTVSWPAAAGFRLAAGVEGSRTGPGADASVPDLVDRVEPDALPALGRTLRHARLGARLSAGLGPGRTLSNGLRARGIRGRLESDLYLGLSDAPDFGVLAAGLTAELPAGTQRELALFLRGAVAEPIGGDELPFTHLPALGGDPGARGFDGDRFRDRALVAGGGEWRWEVWRTIHEDLAVEAFLFLESGTVAPRLEALSAGKLRSSWGGGFRLVTLEGLRGFGAVGVGERIRLDAGVSWPF